MSFLFSGSFNAPPEGALPTPGASTPWDGGKRGGKKRRIRKHNEVINNSVGWKRVGEEHGLTEGKGVASAFEVEGEELIEERVGVGSAEVTTVEMVGDEAQRG